MKSICIKTNDPNKLNYLLNELKNCNLKNICFSENKFKNYNNIIIHYFGNNIEEFFSKLTDILCFLIIDIEEENILEQLILQNYFYFDSKEKEKILSICYDIIADNFPNDFEKKYNILHKHIYDFVCNNKYIILSGFILFRLKEYYKFLDSILNQAVNHFIIEKEYSEFISLLKIYISSQPSTHEVVHLIYSSKKSILLDENKNLIVASDELINAKYLSDISFSSNDYTLNTLLNVIPKKIFVHLTDCISDDFINTIQLIFENRVYICSDCDICNSKYEKTNKN